MNSQKSRGDAIYARGMEMAQAASSCRTYPDDHLEGVHGEYAHGARRALERYRCGAGSIGEAIDLLILVPDLDDEAAASTLARYEIGRG